MKKILTNILLISLLISSLFACNNKAPKTITADTPYYSVTTGSFERSRNVYMSLDIKIPKITYSNNGGNELIDSLNADIESSLTALINEAKNKAQETYETYLQSAKDNVKKDIENKIAELESKYQSVIGKEEKEMLEKLSADDISNFSFSNMGRMYTFPNRMASFSNAFPNWGERFNRGFRPNDNNIEETVSGHINSEGIIDPNLHNKKIIIVETTTVVPTETSISISGRPGIAPSDGFSGNFGDGTERPNRASWSNGRPEGFNKESNQPETNKDASLKTESTTKTKEETTKAKITTKSEATTKNKDIAKEEKPDREFPDSTKKFTRPATKSEVKESEEITLENFYRDLRVIRRYYVPDDYALTIQYIPTTIECDYEIKCLDEDYLSLFVELTESRTTSNVKRLFYNVDLNKMKIINLKDVLGDKYKETSVKYIQEAIDKWSDDQKSTLIKDYSLDNYITENTPFFINNNHKPVIEIEKFAITIGSAGYHEFQIP